MRVLVTGGAGYIGAHVVRALSGHDVGVIDDLSTGSRGRLAPDTPLYEGSVLDTAFVESSLRAFRAEAVVHIAAKKAVDESVADPLFYYRQNVTGMQNLLEAMVSAGTRCFLFSSSAAVYGEQARSPVNEATPTVPSSPYGWTKLIGEQMLSDVAAAHGISWSALRYFNVAGSAAPELADRGENNLIPRVFRAISSGVNPKVYGADYPTPDGSCVRDYVHVDDVAEAHAAVLNRMTVGDLSAVYNIGTGRGTSVFEIMAAVRQATGIDFECDVIERRPGDPPDVVADPAKIRSELGWQSRHDLASAVGSAWRAWITNDG
ncbi:UDP-glucose 4-epimerase GalE [Mycobacterium sp. 852002-51961_SCH5331710]|uniref:UDP-glucose 4-epimerase GalE n=1 Tax=Mycobacterium sp. 852002-51961_SCH5331710 TaxID=1834105 RepID=UPI000801010D|nr:UDP-glucose 4-epimerase GalE [Mycobacterium sp. 852002-51961_SCH5331710]OBB35359.1 UDP-glucose 4-epimerase GalE [Mycobacterium sp. 852002-51961_SCH5331710]